MKCIECGKYICFLCKKTKAVEYNDEFFFVDIKSGLYCLECYDRKSALNDSRHRRYVHPYVYYGINGL